MDELQSAADKASGSGASGAAAAAAGNATTHAPKSPHNAAAAATLQQADSKGELEQGFRDAPACKALSS